jgi:hypothetical protein
MRSRLFRFAGLLIVAVLGAAVTIHTIHGQPPTTSPKTLPADVVSPGAPAAKGVTPASGIKAPAEPEVTRKPAPFDRFKKYDQLPELTREIVFATLRGMEWLSRDGIHQPSGRFIPGLNPALGRATDDDSFIHQAIGAFALARAAKLTGDEKYAVRAGQTILSLLAETPKDTAGARKPVQPDGVCNPVGAAAYLAMAIFEIPDAPADLRQCGEELCLFLKSRVASDGSVQCSDNGAPTERDGSVVHAGPALAALAMSNRNAPATWKQEALARSLVYYRPRAKSPPHPAMSAWLIAAFAEMHLQTKQPSYAECVLEMADWMAKLQYDSVDRRQATWRGGFPAVAFNEVTQSAPTIDTAYFAIGLADACRMIRLMDKPDAARYDRYRVVLTRALQFLTTLQYGDENTVHFAGHFRPVLLGAFHPSMAEGNLRVDQTAAAVCALTQYLIAGADR